MNHPTMSARRVALAALLTAAIGSFPIAAQVKPNVPDVVASARPAIVERITIHGPGLRRYRAIAIDVGDQDGLRVDAGKLHDVLDRYGIANTFEIYTGTHTSDVAVRFQEHVMSFFSRTLSFAPAKR